MQFQETLAALTGNGNNRDLPTVNGNNSATECLAASEFQPRAVLKNALRAPVGNASPSGRNSDDLRRPCRLRLLEKRHTAARSCNCVAPASHPSAQAAVQPLSLADSLFAQHWNSYYGQSSDSLDPHMTSLALRVRLPRREALDADDVIENQNASQVDRSFSTDDE